MSFELHTLSALLLVAGFTSQANAQSHQATPSKSGVEFYYFPGGNDNGQTNFDMSFAINDTKIEDAYFNILSKVKVEIEYQALNDLETVYRTGKLEPKALKSVGDNLFGEITLAGLKEATLYRARVRFYNDALGDKPVQIGAPSDWYYTVTEGSSEPSRLRTKLLLQGIYDNHEQTAALSNAVSNPTTLCVNTTGTCHSSLLDMLKDSSSRMQPDGIHPAI